MKNEKENKVIFLPVVRLVDGKPVVTSLEIAMRFDKRHDNVLRDIRDLECSEEFTRRNFALSDYIDPTGRTLPMYLITEEGFYFLAMGFTGPASNPRARRQALRSHEADL